MICYCNDSLICNGGKAAFKGVGFH